MRLGIVIRKGAEGFTLRSPEGCQAWSRSCPQRSSPAAPLDGTESYPALPHIPNIGSAG